MASSAYRTAVLADGPRVYLRLEEESGTVAKDEMGSIDGTFSGGCARGVPGRVDHAATFDGSGCMLSLGHVLPFLGKVPYTIEAWLRPTRIDTTVRWFFERGPLAPGAAGIGFQFYFRDQYTQTTRKDGVGGDDGYATGAALPVGLFTHVANTFDGTQNRIYLNGAASGTPGPSIANLPDPANGAFVFGARTTNGGGGITYEGAMDEIAIYEKALTETQIRAHYQAAP